MRGITTIFAVFCIIIFFSEYSNSQTSQSIQDYSGVISTFSNKPAMLNRASETRFALNSNFNESIEKGSYNVYFAYTSNFGKIKKGTYKIRILKHIGSRMKEMCYNMDVKNETSSFYDVLALRKGVYSIRIYDESGVLLGFSSYFNVTSKEIYPEYANK